MNGIRDTLIDFLSQPWGVCGAVCIMLAVTCFNSHWLRRRFARTGLGESATAALLNALNFAGGICLLVNAVLRQETVWQVLEVYFVLIAIKGLLQARLEHAREPAALDAWRIEPPSPRRSSQRVIQQCSAERDACMADAGGG